MGPFDELTAAQRQQIRDAHATSKEAGDHYEGTNEPKLACPVCGRTDITITTMGVMRVHGSKQGWPPSNCNGSGQKPKEG